MRASSLISKEVSKPQGATEQTLKTLSRRKSAPKSLFVLLILFYIAASVLTSWASRTGGVFMIFDNPIPIASFAGVFSSLSNFCLIFLVVFYRKPGFVVSLVAVFIQFTTILFGMVMSQNYSSVTGMFTNAFALAVVSLIYLNMSRSERYQDRLRDEAVTDRLTGLPNRFACSELIDRLVERAERFAVVSIDLNNFKGINDTMGQNVGDQVLIEVASRLKHVADSGVSQTSDFVSHQGGDEFMLVIRDYESDEDIVRAIGCYESALEQTMTIDECNYVVTASYGYAEFPADADNGDALFTYADVAMYEVKRMNSSERVRRFTPDLLGTEHALEVERKIRTALDTGSLFFLLQPQFDVSHKLRGFEALARVQDSNGNIVHPAEFIPVAEKVGLADEIDARIFKNSAEFLGQLIQRTGTDITISVNVSVRHLMKNNFLDEVREILAASGAPANQIEVEITESILIDSVEMALYRINELRAMGMKVAIDDFGTGYSSLSYLNSFPADLLKVDKSFIDEMNTSSSSKQYVAAIISIGHIMDFDVIAEGVEDPDQLESLREIGCDFIQGYLWGRPMSPQAAEELVLRSANN